MSAVSKKSGLRGPLKSNIVGNIGSGEIRKGGGIIQNTPGGSGVSGAHVAVGYSSNTPPTMRSYCVLGSG